MKLILDESRLSIRSFPANMPENDRTEFSMKFEYELYFARKENRLQLLVTGFIITVECFRNDKHFPLYFTMDNSWKIENTADFKRDKFNYNFEIITIAIDFDKKLIVLI